MICPYCGCFFCVDYPTDAASLGPGRQLYCSPQHAKKASARRTGGKTGQQRRHNARKRVANRCTRKFRYASAADALTALRWQREDFADGKQGCVYECDDCGGWHLTSRDAKATTTR
jgi:hypothetical protein